MPEQPLPRREDHRLITGAGRYVADFLTPETLVAGFVRAEVASATVDRLDLTAARTVDGVVAVITAADLIADGVGPLLAAGLPRDDGGESETFPQPILSGEVIRHVGEPIALIVARDRRALSAAIEAVEVRTTDRAAPEGVGFLRRAGDPAATEAAFAAAAHVATIRLDVPRVTAMAMEPRGAIATGRDGHLHYRASTQNPFALRKGFADHFGWDPEAIHVEAPDVGGSFGLKGFMTREDAALAWAALRLNAGIAWLPGRSEAFLSDAQGRGLIGEVSVALDAEHRLTGVRGAFEIDAGAYPWRGAFGIMNNINGLTGVYRIGAASAEIVGRLSARAPLAPFRGNGRPEATYAIERALDRAARDLGIDPVELRRRNMIPTDAMPAVTALGTTLDCGDFPKVMAAALDLNAGADARRREAESRGMLFGAGLANCIESAGGPLRGPRPDRCRLTVAQDGSVTVAPGVMSVGQGHETALSAVVAEQLGIDRDRIAYVNGDTCAVTSGRGSGGSAGLSVAGSATLVAARQMIAEGGEHAAEALGCAPEDLAYRDGAWHRKGTNQSLGLAEIAARQPDGQWLVEASFTPPAATFPNGTHICEVEIDPDTGVTRVTRYAAVEDVGTVLVPRLVEGQLHGGIAMGLSVGLGERLHFDGAGQLLSGSLMDYQVARATDLPCYVLGTVEVPTEMNPHGAKGVGEAGTVGATAALASAVSDALARAGVADFDLPATPDRVWTALQQVAE